MSWRLNRSGRMALVEVFKGREEELARGQTSNEAESSVR